MRRAAARDVRVRAVGRGAARRCCWRAIGSARSRCIYCDRADGFVFASEIAALLADPRTPTAMSLEALDAYLALQYVPAPRHDLRGVKKLPPGHTLQIRPRQRPVVRRYYAAALRAELARHRRGGGGAARARDGRGSRALAADVATCRWARSCRAASIRRIVVACMARATGRPVKTFSVGFSEAGASTTSCRTRGWWPSATAPNTTSWSSIPTWWACCPASSRHHGEPFADTSAVPTRYVCEMTRRHVTVALSGDGGDEAFGGYRALRLGARRRAAAAAARAAARGASQRRWARRPAARRAGCANTARAWATTRRRVTCASSATSPRPKRRTSTRPSCGRGSRATDRGGVRGAAGRQRGDRHHQPAAGSGRRHLPARRHPDQGRHRQHDAQPGGARAAGRPPRRRAGRGAARAAQAARADAANTS